MQIERRNASEVPADYCITDVHCYHFTHVAFLLYYFNVMGGRRVFLEFIAGVPETSCAILSVIGSTDTILTFFFVDNPIPDFDFYVAFDLS